MSKLLIRPSRQAALVGTWVFGFMAAATGIPVLVSAIIGSFNGQAAVALFFTFIWGGAAWYCKQRFPSTEVEGDPVTTSVAQDDDFAQKLQKLSELREGGLITQDEFEKKRAEIMKEKW